ncbi:hypothetical protein ACHAWF_012695 [Thalassiosira exigua]
MNLSSCSWFLLLWGARTAVNVADASDSCRWPPERIRLLPRICRSDGDGDGAAAIGVGATGDSDAVIEIRDAARAGRLSRARQIANECLLLLHFREQFGRQTVDGIGNHCCPSTRDEVINAYKQSADTFFHENDDFLNLLVETDEQGGFVADAKNGPPKCWDGRDSSPATSFGLGHGSFGESVPGSASNGMSHGSIAIDRWNDCCSFFHPCDKEAACFDRVHASRLCCELYEGLESHLILPALREPSVSSSLKFGNVSEGKDRSHESKTMQIYQEGSLRMFDVSGVLWPAGYLLGLCLSHPIECGVPEVLEAVNNAGPALRPIAVELGAGVGFASVAFAKAMQYQMEMDGDSDNLVCGKQSASPLVVATDISNPSLALIASNAQRNGVGDLVNVLKANHTDSNSLSLIFRQYPTLSNDGFDVVLGSSLQALFDGTSKQSAALWHSLDAVLSRKNPNAVAIFSHIRTGDERIKLPSAPERLFECVRRVSGDHFGIMTRDGHNSDFELVLLRRKRIASSAL